MRVKIVNESGYAELVLSENNRFLDNLIVKDIKNNEISL